jgi:pyruvate-formate lyase-activating enzyme
MLNTEINSIGFALDPANVPSFLLDWEVTKLCNLNCSYCDTGLFGGHDNTTDHPPLNKCLQTIDFMYEYVNEYMKYKKPSQRKVILNVYGGESLFHPDIVDILKACRTKYKQYQESWFLTITCTTNGIVGKNQWERIVPLIDEFTVSYHSENLVKQKQQYRDNVLYLKQQDKKFKCVIMMHNNTELFGDSEEMIEFCRSNQLRYVAKPLDNPGDEWQYNQTQFAKLKTFWISKVPVSQTISYKKSLDPIGNVDTVSSIHEGRPCCGGRKLSLNGDLKSNVSFVPRQGFQGWSCSVNWFFLFVRQWDGAVYTNKDCLTSTTGLIEPLGYISEADKIIHKLQTQLATGTMPVIKCIKDICMCGFCSPKAENREDFMQLIKRNVEVDVFQK